MADLSRGGLSAVLASLNRGGRSAKLAQKALNGKGKISLTGDAQLDLTFKNLPRRISKEVLRKALRESAKPLVRVARTKLDSSANEMTGNLRRSIGVVSDRSKEYKGSVRVGARMKKGSKNMQGWHGHFIEFGTAPRFPQNGEYLTFFNGENWVKTKRIEGVTPRPFLRPAYNQTKGEITEKFGEIIGSKMVEVMSKYIKRSR